MTAAPEDLVSTLRSQRRRAGCFIRSLGSTAPEALTAPPPALLRLAAQDDHPWRWHCGAGDHHQRHYRVPDTASQLLARCFSGGTAAAPRRSALRHVGAALGRLHAVPWGGGSPGAPGLPGAPAAPGAPPPALRRVHGFLTLPTEVSATGGRPGPVTETAAARRRARFGKALRPGLEQELREDCQVASSSSAGVLSHGWHGFDKWFATDGGGVGLVGEDVGVAAPEHDLASLLAQLVEYHHLAPGLVTAAQLAGDTQALLEGYGGPVDPAWLDREIRLAITRHIGDYALHTRGPESELERYAQLLNTLPPTAPDRTVCR